METLNYIPDDGYTENAYLAPRHGISTAIRFQYRPTPPNARTQLLEGVKKHTAERQEAMFSAAAARSIVSWDIAGKDGELLEVTAANIMRLKWQVYNRIHSIVIFGTDGGDIDPDASDNEKNELADAELDAILGKKPLADVKLAKNDETSASPSDSP
ncbi:hypothetical protein [Rosistilla oblonga]|uniref:hypothetical protein n=1 Tax=Rosistilla oblonga TaxID=2527990 RepID=UPI003A973F14